MIIRKGAICKSTIRVYGRHIRCSSTFGSMDFVGDTIISAKSCVEVEVAFALIRHDRTTEYYNIVIQFNGK